ncbi:MAG: hypothetical protein RIC55_12190 [Pirellulaceae bacterium]
MKRPPVRCIFCAFAVAMAVVASALPAQAETARERVERNLDELHLWLETSQYADIWKTYLRSATLKSELARGAQADPAAIADILAQYCSGHTSLERRRFVAVKQSLADWLAELQQPAPDELAKLAQAASETFETPTAQEQARRRLALKTAVARLDQFLASGGEAKEQGWKTYLDWEALQKQLNSPAPPSTAELRRLEKKFFALHQGFELPVFDEVRQRLRDYGNVVIVADPRARGYYAGQLAKLAEQFKSLRTAAGSEALVGVGRVLGVLEMGDQALALVRQARQVYGRPNVHVAVSEDFLAAGMNEKIHVQQEIRENILGTQIFGRPVMRAETTIDLAPDDQRATFDIRLVGRALSENVGYNGPVTVYTNSVTDVEGRKRIHLDASGFEATPAEAWCETSTVINSIAARLRVVQKIAWRKAGQQKSAAEQVGSRKAEQRVRRQIDQQAAEMVAKLNDAFHERFRWPLMRKDHFPRELRFRTSEDQLLITLLQAGLYQLGAPDDPPAAEQGLDIAVRVHESYIGNVSEGLIGGETLSDARLAKLLEDLTGEVPEQLQLNAENEPWSITFAGTQPIRVRFDDSEARIAVVGSQFTRGAQEIDEPIEIAAVYRIEKTPQGAKFTRQGDVEINFLALESLSVGQVAFKKFMQTRFDAIFKEEVVGKGIELEGRFKKIGRLHLQQIACDGGWAVFGWQAPPADARVAELETSGDR